MGNLKDFWDRWKIKRIDFGDIFTNEEFDTEYASDKLICPYCKEEIEYEGEDTDEILKGTTWHCYNCEKNFRVEAEVSIETTCIPLEDAVMERWCRQHIEDTYKDADICDEKGMEWDLDRPYQYCEYQIFKEYAEPLFENMKNS